MRDKRSARRGARPAGARPEKPRAPKAGGALPSVGWAVALFTLLVVVFFHAVVFDGKTFVAPDVSAPAGFVRMGERSLYDDHVYPLWNPYVFLGMPSFASGAYNPLIYPPDWPVALLQKVLPLPELTWLLIYYVLGAWFMFLLAREWGARPEGAALGAAAFVFAPNLVAVGAHGHGSQLVNSAYIPLLLWLATRWMRMGGVRHLAGLALAGGFQMLRGHVQICFYTWLAVALYTLVEWVAALRRPGGAARHTLRAALVPAAAALAFGIAAFYNLPLREYARQSIRGGGADGGVGMGYATQWSMSPVELPAMVVPGWAGFGGATYWGGMPFTDYPNVYVGMVTVLIALLGVPVLARRGVPAAFAGVLGAVALLVSFGHHLPLYGFLYDHLPLFNKFRVPVMIVVLFQVAIALGAAWGWSTVVERGGGEERARSTGRWIVGLAIGLALALVLVVVGRDAWRGAYIALATARPSEGRPFPPEAAALAYQGFVADLGRVGIIGLLALGAAWLTHKGRLSGLAGGALVLVLLLTELWPVSGRLMEPVIGDPVQRNLEIGRDDVVEFLERQGPPGTFRILPVQEFQSNRYAGFGIATVGGYHAAKTRLVQDLLEARLESDPQWMRLLNVRYIVVPRPLDPAPPYLQQVHAGSQVVYENLLALPRVTLLDQVRVGTGRAVLDSVSAGRVDPAGVVWLARPPALPLGPVAGGTANIVAYRLNDVAIDVDTPGPAVLRLADLWSPDWTVTVDGRPAEVLQADHLLRAVVVPAGKHRVVFRYQPPAMRRGLIVSLASLTVVLALLAVDLVRGRARRRGAAGTETPGTPPVPEAA